MSGAALVVATTRRDDAALLRRYGRFPASPEASAELLRARWPDGHFDEINIAIEAPRCPQLSCALGLVVPGCRRLLSRQNQREIARWLLTVAGVEIDGLLLVRDAIGWCDVVEGAGWIFEREKARREDRASSSGRSPSPVATPAMGI